jgi:hypothetical protein
MDIAALSSLTQTTSAVATQTAKSLQTAVAAKSENLLAGNFVQADTGPSKYLQARLDGYQTDKSFGNSMSTLLTSLSTQFAVTMAKVGTSSGDSTYVAATINKYKAEDGVGQIVDQAVGESAQDNLDATRQDIEDQAEAAASGQSEDAGAADAGTVETTGTTDAPDAVTVTDDIQAAAQATAAPAAAETAVPPAAEQAVQAVPAMAEAAFVPAPGATIDIQV